MLKEKWDDDKKDHFLSLIKEMKWPLASPLIKLEK